MDKMNTEEEIHQFFGSFERLLLKLEEVDNSCVEMSKDITKQGLSIVGLVGSEGQVIMRDIATHLDAPFSTATGIVDKLVDLDYLNRFNSSEDRRIVLIKLTDKGQSLYDLFECKKRELGEMILKQLTNDERKQFIQLFEKIKVGISN